MQPLVEPSPLAGLGKVRHIAVNELWLQYQVANHKVSIHKIKNKFKMAAVLTKYLTASRIEHTIEFMQHSFPEGRSDVAPSLSVLDDDPKSQCQYIHTASKMVMGSSVGAEGSADCNH